MKHILGLVAMVVCAVAVRGADVGDLVKRLQSDDKEERRAAAKELEEGGTESRAAVPALMKALNDRDTFVRRFAAQALGAIGQDAQRAVPALTAALNDSHKEVQEAATRALGKLGSSGLQSLLAVLRDNSRETALRRQAIDTLSGLGAAGRAAIPVLTGLIKEPTGKNKKSAPDDLRVAAAVALGSLANANDSEAIKTLESLGEKKSKAPRELRQAANQSLRKIRKNK